jgi:predicted metalloprotease with PDZ domain
VGDFDERRAHEIAILDAPREWTLYASLGADPADLRVTASYRELISSALGGGAGPHRRYQIQGRPLDVFVHAGLDLPEAEVLEAVERTVRTQRRRMQDFEQPFYNVVLLPRGGVIAGTSIPNLFVCFLKKDITREQLYVLLSHEMFHKWLPNELAITPPEGHTAMRHEWFSEGVTDFLARRLLLDAEVITLEQYVVLINHDLLNLADSPARSATYEELVRAGKEGRFNSTYKKLAYYRGAVIGLNWEAQLRRKDREAGVAGPVELVDLIRELHKQARENGGAFEEQAFFEEMARRGLDARGAFERHVLRGEPIVPEADALEPDYHLEMQPIPAWDPGFDLDATLRARKITGLRQGGPAERAGLAEGLPLVRVANAGRFGNNWAAERPLTVVVEIEGGQRTFRYLPHGEPRPVPQFVPK